MKNFYCKALSLTCICAVFMVIGATDTFAYPTYEGGCVQCHPEFLGGPGAETQAAEILDLTQIIVK